MFKKPKRNFRGRRKDSESGDENCQAVDNVNEEEEEGPAIRLGDLKKAKKKKKDKEKEKTDKPATVLSFHHDEHEEEGQHEFKIKKSSHSKKIAKQLKKELQKEKEEKERAEKLKKENDKSPPPPARNYSSETLKAMIKAQNEMNGSVSLHTEQEEEEEDKKDDKFDKSSAMMGILKSGAIPDAATIHAIRKKRQLLATRGGDNNPDYIPLGGEGGASDNNYTADAEKSRLVREEDHDHSDGDEDEEDERGRIAMGVNKKDAQLRHMHQKMLQAREEDNSGSDHDWEEQQIRKGVHQSSSNTQHHSNNGRERHITTQVTDMEVEEIGHSAGTRRMPNTNLPPVTMESIITKLKSSIEEASSVHRVHVHERDDLAERLSNAHIDIAEHGDGSGLKNRLNAQYAFFQEMRGYVGDLVECLNHKFTAIEYLEKNMFKQYQKYAEQFVKRRQQDIKDEAADALKVLKPGQVEPPPDPEKQRRSAERQARRGRRKRQRQAFQIRDHDDGMSTDDELKPSEISSFNSEKERILTEAEHLFDDVVEDFHQLGPIMERFERWKSQHSDSYEEAYIGLCLPKLFSPLIRLRLIAWNPLEKNCRDFEEMSWFETLIFYGHQDGVTITPHDSDLKLMPNIIEKVLLPKLTAFIEQVWDPLSTQQTVRLINLAKRLVQDYPTFSSDSKATKALIKSLMERMRKTLTDDVFLPLYPKPILEANKTALAFFQRQFWQCVKLLDNALKWHGIIADKPLQELAFDGLLNRYIVLGLQNSPLNHSSVYASQVVISTFPSEWYVSASGEGDPIPGLQPLARYFLNAATSIDQATATMGEIKKKETRDRIKQLCKMLVQIKATNSALQLANKYSFKLGQL